MDIIDSLSQLASRLPRLRETVQTEEATKNALVMPFLQSLGYNVFDPFEVVPEYTSDVGTKKGEKVDYVTVVAWPNKMEYYVGEELDLARKYRVMSVPTLLVLKNGEVVNRSMGAIPKNEVLSLIG